MTPATLPGVVEGGRRQMERIKGLDVQTIDGRQCLVIAGDKGAKIAIPADGWNVFVADAERRVAAVANQAARGPGWSLAVTRGGLPAQVGTTDERTVALTACLGTPSEVSLSFPRQEALDIADSLRATAESLPKSPSKAN